ncbi:ABC transporter permease subunit [Mesorhizobium sp. C277A]|uniref:ABC transporter permease n=1 Tax=Mesorhizobium sp. C277A TaxID=2956827 RepID=UPI00333CF58B
MNLGLIFDALVVLPSGIGLTLILTVLSLTAGFLLSVPLAFMRAFGRPGLSLAVLSYTYVIRGTPMLVQLFLLYYGLAQIEAVRASIFWVILRDPFWCALLTFSLNSAAHTTEILCRGLQSVPKGVTEAATSLGLKRFQIARLVTFPIAFRISLPAYGNEIVGMIKGSSLASTVTLLEITGMARQMVSTTFAPYEIFIVAGAIYLSLTSIAVKAIQLLERWLSTDGHPVRRRKARLRPALPDPEITTPLP